MSESIKISALKRSKNLSSQEPQKKDNSGKDTITANNILTREISFKKPFPDNLKESFYLELSSLMRAGLDLGSALHLLCEEHSKKKTKQILEEVITKVINGSSLSSALKENKNFSSYEYFTVEIGEETGELIKVFSQLSLFFKSKVRQRRQIVSALTYPAIVLTVAFCSIFFMMDFVVPMFADMFKRFGGELPFLTRMTVELSDFIKKYALIIILGFAVIIAIIYFNRKKRWYKANRDSILLKLPVIKGIVLKTYLSRFASTMGLLTGAKVPLMQALSLTGQVVNFIPLEIAAKQLESDILKGMNLHESMRHNKIFPKKMVALVKVGEEVNQLELFFNDLSERYTNELEYQTSQISKFIEPVIILLLGVMVGVVLIAMYLPMFNMGNMMQ